MHDNQVPLFVKCNGFVTILFQLANEKITLSVDVPVLTQYVFVDSSIQDTRFSFTYSADVNVEVKMVDNSSDIIVSRLPTEKKVVAEINGTAVIQARKSQLAMADGIRGAQSPSCVAPCHFF